jgi:hypothetical protein
MMSDDDCLAANLNLAQDEFNNRIRKTIAK